MDIVNAASIWAKAEINSAKLFMLFGLVYLLLAIAFWQFGNTAFSKTLIIPTLVAGALLLSAGIGFYQSNKSKLASFAPDYKANPSVFVKSEIERTEKTIKTYEQVALKVFPAIIFVAALLSFFIAKPLIKAICFAIIAFLLVLVILDSQALKRMKTYHQKLELAEKDLSN